jgi:hypothetical protein
MMLRALENDQVSAQIEELTIGLATELVHDLKRRVRTGGPTECLWPALVRGCRLVQKEDLAAVEHALSEATGAARRLRVVEEFRRGRVARCAVIGDDEQSVVVKVAGRNASPAQRALFANEQAALTLLNRLAPGCAVELLAVESAVGAVVLEDLGDEPTVASRLLGADEHSARAALLAHAAALGAMHSASVGHAEEFDELRRSAQSGVVTTDRMSLRNRDMTEAIAGFPGLLSDYGLPRPGPAVLMELEAVKPVLADPGGFLALTSGDPCPDNNRITSAGVQLFDFDAAAFRHALTDGAHYRLPFPNCWCWRALPSGIAADANTAYRQALAVGCDLARDSGAFFAALTAVTVAWSIWIMNRWLPRVAKDVVAQQRIVGSLAEIVDLAAMAETSPELQTWAADTRKLLSIKWGPSEAPTYPAFGGPPFQPHY